jgi:hypothetical protein
MLTPDVWMIEEKYFMSWNRANIFFVRGSSADLIVDTGELYLREEERGLRGASLCPCQELWQNEYLCH